MFGCLSYDLKDEIFNIPSNSNDNLNSDHISFFIPKYVILAKGSKIEILTYENKESTKSLINQISTYYCNEQKLTDITFKARESKQSYLQKINKIKYHIKRGDIYEINYCQEFFNDNTTFEDFKEQEQINIIKKEISKVYTRIYEKDNLDNISFDIIWDSSKDNTFPWDNMEQYEDKIKNQRALKQPLPPLPVYENDYYYKNNNAVKLFRSFNKKRNKVTVMDDLPF